VTPEPARILADPEDGAAALARVRALFAQNYGPERYAELESELERMVEFGTALRDLQRLHIPDIADACLYLIFYGLMGPARPRLVEPEEALPFRRLQ